MAPALEPCLRWLVVYHRVYRGVNWRDVQSMLCVSKTCQSSILSRFWSTGDVMRQRPDHAASARVLTHEMEMDLFHDVLDAPRATLNQRAATLELLHGVTVSISTICRAMRRLRLSQQSPQHYALRRDEHKAQAFWTEIIERGLKDAFESVDAATARHCDRAPLLLQRVRLHRVM